MFVPELPIIKEIENCGKRYRRNPRKPNPDYMDENHPDRKNYAECFWNCEVFLDATVSQGIFYDCMSVSILRLKKSTYNNDNSENIDNRIMEKTDKNILARMMDNIDKIEGQF